MQAGDTRLGDSSAPVDRAVPVALNALPFMGRLPFLSHSPPPGAQRGIVEPNLHYFLRTLAARIGASRASRIPSYVLRMPTSPLGVRQRASLVMSPRRAQIVFAR